jgi:pimeloyl-ACP methyl ester carboxylesterase
MANPDYDWRLSVLGTGEALVLVPGMDGTGQLFYRQTPSLSESFRTATYALRSNARTMDTLVDDLACVIDTVASETRRAVVVGESFGGALAMSFALARPEQVSALVVLNSFRISRRSSDCGSRATAWRSFPGARCP